MPPRGVIFQADSLGLRPIVQALIRSNVMKKLADWIKSHQVTAFFVITFAITWGLGFSYSAVLQQGEFYSSAW